jgi:ABC-type uncharacterized transport system permease subunit
MNETALGLIAATLAAGTPLAIAGLGLLINEKAGVLNLGAEGMMLMARSPASRRPSTPAARLAGAAGPGAAAGGPDGGGVRRAGDLAEHQPVRHRPGAQPVRRRLLGLRRHALRGPEAGRAVPSMRMPVLADIPLLGPALFRQHPMVYLAIAADGGVAGLVPLPHAAAGLVLRAVGESPESAHALGYPVRRIRLAAVMAGGALCGVAGAYLSVVYTPLWVEGMVAGRGWIALALTVFATWRPAAHAAGRLPVRRRHDAAVPPAGPWACRSPASS